MVKNQRTLASAPEPQNSKRESLLLYCPKTRFWRSDAHGLHSSLKVRACIDFFAQWLQGHGMQVTPTQNLSKNTAATKAKKPRAKL